MSKANQGPLWTFCLVEERLAAAAAMDSSTALALRSTNTDLASLTDAAKDLQLARAGDRGPGSALEVAQQQALQERRCADRERHFHSEVWTKDPHGGRHRKVCS